MSAVLHYFDGRGKAEIIRLVMAAAGIKFTQVNIREKHEFEKLKADKKLLFGQLPLVEFEGKNLVQSASTSRYFASRGNLLGETPDEVLKIDVLYEGTRDLNSAFMSYGFQGFQEVLDKAKQTALPRYLPIFNTVLEENGSNGYLVGSKLSLADIGLLEPLLTIEELLGEDELKPYADLQKFLKNMKDNAQIAEYLSSSLRPRKNDERYIQEVKSVIF